jgi:hypothetical protein
VVAENQGIGGRGIDPSQMYPANGAARALQCDVEFVRRCGGANNDVARGKVIGIGGWERDDLIVRVNADKVGASQQIERYV